MTIEVIPLPINREIDIEDNLVSLVASSKQKLQDGDILVLSQTIISKHEGRIVNLSTVIPSILALGIGSEYDKSNKKLGDVRFPKI